VLPVFWITRSLSFRLDTDYDVLFPAFRFLEYSFKNPAQYLLWNPFIGTGMSNLGDIQSFIWSPLFVLPVLLFGVDMGLRVIVTVAVLLSGFFMRVFLRSLHIQSHLCVWGACLYEVSGTVAARFAAGHIIYMYSYAFVPLILWAIIQKNLSYKKLFLIGVIIASMILYSDFYTPWFVFLIFLVARGYYTLRYRMGIQQPVTQSLFVGLISLVFILPKLYFTIRYVLPHFQRYASDVYSAGSIHAFLFPFVFIIPWQVMFYDRPFFQRLFGFYYNWYEYYAFISLLPFLALLYIKNVIKKDIGKIFLLILLLGACYISMKYSYSPFYWIFRLFPSLQIFRVAQRIVIPLTSVVVSLCALCLAIWFEKSKKDTWKRLTYWIILSGSFCWTFYISMQTFIHTFAPKRTDEESVATQLRSIDDSNYYVADFVCCMQTFLVNNKIPIINFYYSWKPKETPSFLNEKQDGYNFDILRSTRPTYIIAYTKDTFDTYDYSHVFSVGTIAVWKTDSPNIFPSL
jgi:pimeloyl-ACP methyl ester carboxylesterase